MAASLLLQSSVLRLPSSSFNRNFFSDFTSRLSTVSFMPRVSLFDEARLAQTLISAPRPLQSLKIIRNFCCNGTSVDGDGEEKEYPGYMDVSEDDVVSDESIWKLYERWCVHFNITRSLAEKQKRFHIFKEDVLDTYKINQEARKDLCGLSEYADRTEDPRICSRPFFMHLVPDVINELRDKGYLSAKIGFGSVFRNSG